MKLAVCLIFLCFFAATTMAIRDTEPGGLRKPIIMVGNINKPELADSVKKINNILLGEPEAAGDSPTLDSDASEENVTADNDVDLLGPDHCDGKKEGCNKNNDEDDKGSEEKEKEEPSEPLTPAQAKAEAKQTLKEHKKLLKELSAKITEVHKKLAELQSKKDLLQKSDARLLTELEHAGGAGAAVSASASASTNSSSSASN